MHIVSLMKYISYIFCVKNVKYLFVR